MKIISILLLFLTLLSCKAFNQITYFKYPIYLDVSVGYLLYSSNKLDSSVVTSFSSEESKSIKVFDNNARGKLKFSLSDTAKKVFIKGQYLETSIIKSDMSKIKRDGKRVTTGRNQPTTAKYYYKPVRESQWFYYDINGDVIKIENYVQGKLCNAK